jgi:hypothetical protein
MQTLFSATPTQKPRVVTWYAVYCILMALLYVAVAIAGVAFLAFGSFMEEEKVTVVIVGVVYILIGLILVVPFALAPFFPPKPWNWIYGLVMIALGMTSCCCLPASIPLLIYWIKPDVKHYFGRQ